MRTIRFNTKRILKMTQKYTHTLTAASLAKCMCNSFGATFLLCILTKYLNGNALMAAHDGANVHFKKLQTKSACYQFSQV